MSFETYDDSIAQIKIELGIANEDFSKLPDEQSQPIIRQIEEKFVEGLNHIWWWDHLRQFDFVTTHADDGGWSNQLLPELTEKVWFVVEPRHGEIFSLYDAVAKNLERVLDECPYFEYYVVSKDLSWLIGENHHGYFFFVGKAAANRICQLVQEKPEQWQSSYQGE